MKKPFLLVWVSAVVLGLPATAFGQGTLAFNNLDARAGLVTIDSNWKGAEPLLLNQDLNFALMAAPSGETLQMIHVWRLSDGTAKGINVAPGRFKDPSDGAYAVPGVTLLRGDVDIQIVAWPGHYDTPSYAARASASTHFAMNLGGPEATPRSLLSPRFTVDFVPVPYHLAGLRLVWTNGLPGLSLIGRIGYGYTLEYASALSPSGTNPWQNLMNPATWVLTNSLQFFTDESAAGAEQRFYRVGAFPIPPPPSLVWISPGTFLMGSPTNEADRAADESPQTRVTLTYGFWIGQYEVKQIEYQSIMAQNPSEFIGDPDFPVDSVTWEDGTNYCAQLTDYERLAGRLPEGYAYRLPTEAEWEYAARAGTTTRFSYGDDPGYVQLSNYAWYGANSGGQTHPVGQKQPNPWGLYDMYGNVEEWCLDWYGDYPGGTVTDPKGPASGSWRVLRGGSYLNAAETCGSTSRGGMGPENWDGPWGLRVVLAPVQP